MKPSDAQNSKRVSTWIAIALLLLIAAAQARKFHARHQDFQSAQSSQPGEFDYYLLALSWSPAFCAKHANAATPSKAQCQAKLGFVVHGLWPQNNSKNYPHDCGPAEDIPSAIAEIADKATPPMPPGDKKLLQHEWAKHGTCSGLSMPAYFTAIKDSAAKVKIPPALQAPETDISMDANAVAEAFTAVNPGLTANMMNIEADHQGNINSVEICFSKQLIFQDCAAGHKLQGGRFLGVN